MSDDKLLTDQQFKTLKLYCKIDQDFADVVLLLNFIVNLIKMVVELVSTKKK